MPHYKVYCNLYIRVLSLHIHIFDIPCKNGYNKKWRIDIDVIHKRAQFSHLKACFSGRRLRELQEAPDCAF